MVPVLEAMPIKIQQLDLNQVRSLGSINPIMPPSIAQVVTGLKLLEYWVKSELAILSAKIDSKSVFVKGRWFRSLDGYIMFSQKHVP